MTRRADRPKRKTAGRAGSAGRLTSATFAPKLIDWQRRHGRHDLPWQNTRDPYRIWLSEIMLQQTQVSAVVPYYLRFLERFPTVAALAAAEDDAVMRRWAGLGYYSRARNLHRAAALIVEAFGGRFPDTRELIESLPGVGRSTAAAIAAFAFGRREAILDGNVKRVLTRCFAVPGYPGERAVESELWALATALLPAESIEAYTQGLMDLGATLCTRTRPRCPQCPLQGECRALAQGRVDELPTPKPRKSLPHRRTTMLVLCHAGEVLLEKRPAPGIWGGLWCFPEIDTEVDLRRLCRDRFGCEVLDVRSLPPIAHGFTHYSLDIAPLLVRVRRSPHRVAEPGSLWQALADAQDAALPVPAKKIVRALLADEPLLFEEPVQHL